MNDAKMTEVTRTITEDVMNATATAGPFAGLAGEQIRALTAAQCAEHCRKFIAAMTPGERARYEAQKAVDKLVSEVPCGRLDIVATPTELERRRQMNNFGAAWYAIDNVISQLDEECQVSIVLYTNFRRCIEADYELGKFSGPDGAKARKQKTENARARAQKIFLTVKHFLIANPQIPLRASENCACEIKPAIEEIFGGKVSLSDLTTALCKFRKESLAR
jgi:hypothetical protein